MESESDVNRESDREMGEVEGCEESGDCYVVKREGR